MHLVSDATGETLLTVARAAAAQYTNVSPVEQVADITETKDQFTLFDQLLAEDRVPKVVDVGHSLFDKFFTVIQQIGLVEEARQRGATPVVLFLADGDRRSRQGYAVLRDRFAHLPIVPVINEALPQAIRFRDDFLGTRTGGAPLTIPALSPVIKGVIERPSFSFAALAVTASDTPQSFTAGRAACSWNTANWSCGCCLRN